MRKYLWLLSILLYNCSSADKQSSENKAPERKDPMDQLCQYWIIEDADFILERDIIQIKDGRDMVPGLVFLNDGSFVENPAGITYRGTFTRNGDQLTANYENGEQAIFTIKKLSLDSLFVNRKIDDHESNILYKGSHAWWPDIKENPFTVENFSWTIKPSKPETDEEIKQRCKDCIRFYQYFIAGHVRGKSPAISFSGFPSCLNWYSGGIGLKPEKDLNEKWIDCFYNEEQALKGYALIRHAILKKYDWDANETNWMKQAVPVLQQMRDSL